MISSIKNFILFENIQQAKSILNKKGLDSKTEKNYNDIVKMFNNLPNLIGKFVEFNYIDNVPMENIKNVANWILNNRQIVSKLPNNILNYKDFEKLEDDIEKLNRNQLIKKFYNSLYRSMKEEIDKMENRDNFDELAYNFMKLPEELKKNFTPLKYFEVNNISLKDFMNALSSYIENNTVNSDKESILKIINEYKDKIKIVYDKDNVLVIQSNDKEVIKKLGSQSWCIVYSADHYQEVYFGYGKGNTQYIIFDFNLPSTSSNSLYGITIDENGNTMYGACQDKYNRGKEFDSILDTIGIPKDIIKPDKDIIKEKETLKEFETILKESSLIDILNYIKNNDMKNINKDFINKILSNYRRQSEIEEDLKRLLINNKDNLNEFLNKYDIFSLLSDSIIMKPIFVKSSEEVFGNLDNIILLLLYHIKNRDNRIFDISFRTNMVHNTYFFNVINKVKIDDINRINDKYNILDDDEKIKMIYDLLKNYVKNYISFFLNLELFRSKEEVEWDTYLNFYNKYGLKLKDDLENYDYYSLLTTFAGDKLFYFFIDNDEFTDFIIKLAKEHPNDFDIRGIVTQNNQVGYYDLFSHDNIARIYEELELMPYNTIETIFLFNNTKMITYDELSKELNIKKWEDEGYYVEFSDFTELDSYFEYDYFNNIDDNWYDYGSDVSNYDAINSIELSNIKNIKEICHLLNTDKLLNDDINNRLSEIYEMDKDELTKLKRDIIKIVDINEDDLHDLISSLKRSINRAYNISYENEVFETLINEIIGELPFKRFKDGKNYKFKDNKVCFLLDLNLLSEINDYNDLHYNCDENFKWYDLMDYHIKDIGKLKPYLDNVYADWEDYPDDFNDELNYQLGEI